MMFSEHLHGWQLWKFMLEKLIKKCSWNISHRPKTLKFFKLSVCCKYCLYISFWICSWYAMLTIVSVRILLDPSLEHVIIQLSISTLVYIQLFQSEFSWIRSLEHVNIFFHTYAYNGCRLQWNDSLEFFQMSYNTPISAFIWI